MKSIKQKREEAIVRRRYDLGKHNDNVNQWAPLNDAVYRQAVAKRARALSDIHNLEAKGVV